MKEHDEQPAKSGCSLMSDGCTNKKNRTLINFLVTTTMCVTSVDASTYMKIGEKLFELF